MMRSFSLVTLTLFLTSILHDGRNQVQSTVLLRLPNTKAETVAKEYLLKKQRPLSDDVTFHEADEAQLINLFN